MSPRVIHMPLSGGDRKHLAKEMRIAETAYHYAKAQEAQIRKEIAARERDADQLACEAWNAALFLGAELEPQETPTLGQVLNAGFDAAEVRCNRCSRISVIKLTALKRPPIMFMHRIERSLTCQECSRATGRAQKAHFLKISSGSPSPETPREEATPRRKARR